MKTAFKRSVIAAVLLFIGLFAFKLAMDQIGASNPDDYTSYFSDFKLSKRNYASEKKFKSDQTAQPIGDSQKYEKIATLTETTKEFDATRKKTSDLIAASEAQVQYEQLAGLTGRRVLHLGIGVPPPKFDDFIEEARKLARLTSLTIVKNDKTNEFRELRAKRDTLEKARKALTDLAGSGGSVDERLKVQGQLTELEQKIQDLGVSMGDFDTQNEFCTVMLALSETATPRVTPWSKRLFTAFEWSVWRFFTLAAGYLMLWIAFWVSSIALAMAVRVTKKLGHEE